MGVYRTVDSCRSYEREDPVLKRGEDRGVSPLRTNLCCESAYLVRLNEDIYVHIYIYIYIYKLLKKRNL